MKVIGVGATGSSAVGRVSEAGLSGVEFSAAGTRDEVREALTDAAIVFVVWGEGAADGPGTASEIVEISEETDALTIGVVLRSSELGDRGGIESLRQAVDALLVLDTDKVPEDGMHQAVQGITDLLAASTVVNPDLAGIQRVIRGSALVGMGAASGENRAAEATKNALNSPLLDGPIAEAAGILLNITGGDDLGLPEVSAATETVARAAGQRRGPMAYPTGSDDTNMVVGAVVDSSLADEVRVTVWALFGDRPLEGTAS